MGIRLLREKRRALLPSAFWFHDLEPPPCARSLNDMGADSKRLKCLDYAVHDGNRSTVEQR
jgi:hypothetical protein